MNAQRTRADDDDWSYPLQMSGQAGTLPMEQERDFGAELRAVVKEVTGKDVPVPEKRRIGFY